MKCKLTIKLKNHFFSFYIFQNSLLDPASKIEVNQNDIPLYRLPQGVRRQIKMQEKETGLIIEFLWKKFKAVNLSEGSKYNKTAQNIKVDHVRALSAKTFQELIKDKVDTTNTIFLTENNYQVEMTNG